MALESEEEERKALEKLACKSYQKLAVDEFKRSCYEMRSQHTNQHLTSFLRLMVEEQNHNEQILLESLKQLKNLSW